MTITNQQEKQVAIQRIRTIASELDNFGSKFGKLEEQLRANSETKKQKLDELEAQKKQINQQFDGNITKLKEEIKQAKDGQKDKRKELEKELSEIKTGLGEYELQAALA
jgi:predicted  nucleic acid-binding Zn-ribbon protein